MGNLRVFLASESIFLEQSAKIVVNGHFHTYINKNGNHSQHQLWVGHGSPTYGILFCCTHGPKKNNQYNDQ